MVKDETFRRLESFKSIASTVQSVVTIFALAVGGIWTYRHFHLERHDHPRLTIQHRISHRTLPNGIRLLSVDEIYSNPSPVLLDIRKGNLRIIRILPLPPTPNARAKEAASLTDDDSVRDLNDNLKSSPDDIETWPLLAFRKLDEKKPFSIEPGEGDQLHHEFLIPANIQTVAVMTYITNPTSEGKEIGWRAVTIYDLTPDKIRQSTYVDH